MREVSAITEDRRTRETRNKMFNLISENPGLHLSRIAETFEMSTPLAEYHLINMAKDDLIIDVKDNGGRYKRFYVKNRGFGKQDKKYLSLLRQKPLLKIVVLLLEKRRLKHKELREHLNIASSTLSYRLNKLVDNGILETYSYGKDKGYALKDENEILWVICKYKLDSSVKELSDQLKKKLN